MASLGRLSEQRESCVSIEPICAEVVETVVGVVRLLRRAAELAWRQADAGGPRSSHQLLALGIDSAVENVSGVLLRAAQFDGPTAVEENPAELVKKLSARHMRIRSISKRFVEGASRPGSTGPATGASINRS
jgi:hypothetical protein